jgi:toxin-antitoxin system PIN domain toxin
VLCVDVNVLVDAFRPDAPDHESVRAWLDAARRGPERVIVLPEVASSFVRIVTNRRIWRLPSPATDALAFVDALGRSPSVDLRHAGPRQWELMAGLMTDLGLSGDDVPDAYLAAAAIELGCTFVTSDRGFARFPQLRVLRPT